MPEHNAELIQAATAVRDRLLAFVGAVADMTDCGPDVDAIKRLNAALSRAKAGGGEPTLFWDAEDWENGGADPADVVSNYAPGEVVKMDTAIHGPPRWGVMSPDGEVRAFPTAEEAEAWFHALQQEPR